MLETTTSSTSSPSLKVKVIYGEGRLVIPCGDANDKVHRLINDINRRFQSYLGDATVRAKELTTSDGFLINPHDRIADVIDDGAVLRALDYNTWLDQNLPLLEKKWHEVGRADYALDRRPWRSVEIGLHKHRKLYVKISSVYKTIDRLELFDAESLTSFGKAGTVLIARKEVKQDGEDWFIEASFVVDASGVVTAVELQVKTTSDVRPQIERVGINHDLTIGKVLVIQSADPPKPDKTYTLPPAKRTGSSFTNILSEHLSKPFEEGEVPENKATGNCGLDIAQKDVTQADSTWYRKDQEGFYNNFYNHLTIFNPAEKEIAIVKITSEIEKDGAWVPTEFRMGSKSGYYRYNMSSWDPAEGFTLASNDRLNLATESSVLIKAKQFDRARRAHRSLPQPVRIRLTFVNKEGGTSQIVLEQRNKLLEVPTVESREDLHKQKVVSFIYADDLETEARIFVDAILKEKDGYGNERLELSSVDSKGAYITKSTQRWALYQARKEGKSEVLLEEFSQESEEKGYSVKAYVLVDLEAQWAYALKVEINTNTSSTVDYIPLPLLSDD